VAEKNYVVATIKPWNVQLFHDRTRALPGRWHLVETKDALTAEYLEAICPRYVFFPHWSWIVPEAVLQRWECVCFHMTDLPYGRGGSPLQNLIVRGKSETKLSALRMEAVLDAGPIYMKKPLSLRGSAEDIYVRAAELTWDMIAELVATEPVPQPQVGTPEVFARRNAAQSELPSEGTPQNIYDHIRMLDAPTYPHAFVQHGAWKIEFRSATLKEDAVEASVVITRKGA
jgi:methionyl-tRNA formyltransferase